MEYTTLLWIFGLCSSEIQANSHWMVTETGLIQPRDDSPFEMARPFDLLAFLNQDIRWDNIYKYHSDLTQRQADINKLWKQIETEGDINTLIHMDNNCHQAGPFQALDWYGSYFEDGTIKNIEPEEYLLTNPLYGEDVDIPDCKKISSLTFSMSTFEHLESVRNRENLTINAELSLPERISPIMTVEQYGHWLATILRRNSSSWLHYNMASLYWRVRGNAAKALECSRRAVHYAPRDYKSIALLSMGTIVYRSKRPEDASIILEAVVDHDNQLAHGHFLLANVYAILGDYNNSYKHYEKALKIDSSLEQAIKNMHGVKCVERLLKKMIGVHKLLKNLKDQLSEYLSKEDHWMRTQAAFLKTMKSDNRDYRNVEQILEKWTEFTDLDMKELKKWGDKYSYIYYYMTGPTYDPKWAEQKGVFAMDNVVSIQRLVKHISKHANPTSETFVHTAHSKTTNGKIVKEYGPMPVFPELSRVKITFHNKMPPASAPSNSGPSDDLIHQFELGLPLYPANMRVSRNIHDFDRDPDWPTDTICNEYGTVFPKNMEFYYPVFMPFENKGLSIKGLLTDSIGVAVDTEHELPWHPPICSNSKDATTQKKTHKLPLLEVINSGHLRQLLLEYAGDSDPRAATRMQDVEIGQRIYAAMQMNIAPKWLINTLASLYWRVRSNNQYSLNCLISASKEVPLKYKDLVMTSMASVYLEMGLLDDAFVAAEEAFKVNSYEPSTNFVIAGIQMMKKDRESQLSHLKTVIRVDANFLDGLAKSLLTAWACYLRQDLALKGISEFQESEGHCETHSEFEDLEEKLSAKCVEANKIESASSLIRLMEIHNEHVQPDEMDESVFDPFILNMPLERTDKKGHQENFELMLKIFDTLKGCGPKGCSNITPEDLDLKEEDCSYQYLQIGYWMHIITFKQLLDDNDLKLPSDIATYPGTKGRIPECKVMIDPENDFFLDKIYNVDVEDWSPLLSLMHQVEDLFVVPDYSALGTKIARLVETKPRWWVGMLGAGWWCAAGGAGRCAVRCVAAAYSLAPAHRRHHAVRALATMLTLQNRTADGKLVSQLSFYMSPKTNTEAFLVAASHTFHQEYEQAVWMYRYALTFDDKFLPAKACLHATMCTLLFKDKIKPNVSV